MSTQEDPNEKVWACPDCKSTNVQCQMWVDPNSLKVYDDTGSYQWCLNCEKNDESVPEGCGGDGEKKSLDLIPRCETLEWKESHPVQIVVAGEPFGTNPQWGVFKVKAAKSKDADDYESLLGVRDTKEKAIELAHQHANPHLWPIGVREFVGGKDTFSIIE